LTKSENVGIVLYTQQVNLVSLVSLHKQYQQKNIYTTRGYPPTSSVFPIYYLL